MAHGDLLAKTADSEESDPNLTRGSTARSPVELASE
jgi:hypothetical protein